MRILLSEHERTNSEISVARLWRLPPKSTNTRHRHPKMEELYFVVEGIGRIRIGEHSPKAWRGVLVGPKHLRLVFGSRDDGKRING
jgi:mannose-6-phosphate isomerase-like protein (cupin superfamily)